jgi:OmpA-OmpF porin, OOP family
MGWSATALRTTVAKRVRPPLLFRYTAFIASIDVGKCLTVRWRSTCSVFSAERAEQEWWRSFLPTTGVKKMMIKARTGLAALGLASTMAFAVPAFAQDAGFYIGLSFGQSSVDLDCTGASSCDDTDTAMKFIGGYRFNRNLGVEIGYTDLGEATITDPISTATFETSVMEIVGVGSLPIAEKFSVFGKIGIYRGDVDASDPVFGSASESNTGLTFGIGVQWDFTKNLGLRGEWQRYADVGGDSVGESDVDVMSIGVIWRF